MSLVLSLPLASFVWDSASFFRFFTFCFSRCSCLCCYLHAIAVLSFIAVFINSKEIYLLVVKLSWQQSMCVISHQKQKNDANTVFDIQRQQQCHYSGTIQICRCSCRCNALEVLKDKNAIFVGDYTVVIVCILTCVERWDYTFAWARTSV